jgi:hypothetical protein
MTVSSRCSDYAVHTVHCTVQLLQRHARVRVWLCFLRQLRILPLHAQQKHVAPPLTHASKHGCDSSDGLWACLCFLLLHMLADV